MRLTRCGALVMILCMGCLCYFLVTHVVLPPRGVQIDAIPNNKPPRGDNHLYHIENQINGSFYKALKSRASADNLIFLASVDSAFTDMAVNMYLTSFSPFSITHYLFVCSDEKAVSRLAKNGIYCFLFPQNTKNDVASEYGSTDFILKMRAKMKLVTAAVIMNFTVVLTDVDVVFFRDPTPHLRNLDADISLMSDVVMDNCGFYVVRPTTAGIELQKRTLNRVMTRIIADQDAIVEEIGAMVSKRSLHKTNLDPQRFSCGLVYFEDGKRMFNSDNYSCRQGEALCSTYVVHNNWIVGKQAKVYRFKETGLWMYNGDDGYYTNPSRKYIQYSNPTDFGGKNKQKEKDSLKAALTLGKLLNRTVILPKFHCNECKYKCCEISADHCSFNTHFHVQSFDQYFHNQYREHVFLEHSRVPKIVKGSTSPYVYIVSKTTEERTGIRSSAPTITFKTTDNSPSVTAEEIIHWFGQGSLAKFSVLRIHSLYLNIHYDNKLWSETLEKALKWSDYRQYKAW